MKEKKLIKKRGIQRRKICSDFSTHTCIESRHQVPIYEKQKISKKKKKKKRNLPIHRQKNMCTISIKFIQHPKALSK